MSSTHTEVPVAVRAAFRLYLTAVAVSALSAVAQLHFAISPPPVLYNPLIELVLVVAVGLQMRAGKSWARLGLFSIAMLIMLLNLIVAYGLIRSFGSIPTYQVVLLMVLVSGKVALFGAATWMMYRPQNQVYFG